MLHLRNRNLSICEPCPNDVTKTLLKQKTVLNVNDVPKQSYLEDFQASSIFHNTSKECQAVERMAIGKLESEKNEMENSLLANRTHTTKDVCYRDKMLIAKTPGLLFRNFSSSRYFANPAAYYQLVSPFPKMMNLNTGNLTKNTLPNRNYTTNAKGDENESLTQVLHKMEESNTIRGSDMDFKGFLNSSDIWVDKSMLLDRILKLKNEVVILTCPRKWGKSLNLSMLQYFLDCNLDKETKTMMNEFFTKGSYTNENGKVEMNKAPLISKESNVIKDYLHRCPVIYLDFKIIEQDSWYDRFCEIIIGAFKKHKYLVDDWKNTLECTSSLESCKIHAKINLNLFERIVSRDANKTDMIFSIQHLSNWLKEKHGRGTIVLIDEYESVYNDILFNTERVISEKRPSDSIDFMGDFMEETFKNCPASGIQKVVLTGILHIANTTLLGGLDNVFHNFNLINLGTLAPFYGFSSSEVQCLVQLANVNFDEEKDTIEKWYNGYKVMNAPQEMYSPWSIVNYCVHKQVPPYFEMSGSLQALQQLLNHNFFYVFLEKLLATTEVPLSIPLGELERMNVGVYEMLYKLLRTSSSTGGIFVTDEQTGIIVIMVQAGYLAYKEHVLKEDGVKVILEIPNYEIWQGLNRIFNSVKYQMFVEVLQRSGNFTKQIGSCASVFKDWFDENGSNEAKLEKLGHKFERLFKACTKLMKAGSKKKREKYSKYFDGTVRHLSEASLRQLIALVLTEVSQESGTLVLEEYGYKMLKDGEKRRQALALLYNGKAVIIELQCFDYKPIDKILEQAINYSPLLLRQKEYSEISEVIYLAMNFKKGKLEIKEKRVPWKDVEKIIESIEAPKKAKPCEVK